MLIAKDAEDGRDFRTYTKRFPLRRPFFDCELLRYVVESGLNFPIICANRGKLVENMGTKAQNAKKTLDL